MIDEKELERMKKKEAFLKKIGSKGTIRILQLLEAKGEMRYKDLQEFLNTHTLNARIKDLLSYNLIQHHIIREEIRKEWYTTTDKGKEVLDLLDQLTEVAGL